MQVESARADLMGISFGIDFFGSTNFAILPPAVATKTSPSATAAATDSEDVGTLEEGQSTSCAAAVCTTELSGGVGKEGDCNKSVVGVASTMARGAEATSAAGRNNEEGDAVAGGGSGEVLNGMSARVSTQAFCRTVVARVTVRDPKVGGTIKVGKGFRTTYFEVCRVFWLSHIVVFCCPSIHVKFTHDSGSNPADLELGEGSYRKCRNFPKRLASCCCLCLSNAPSTL